MVRKYNAGTMTATDGLLAAYTWQVFAQHLRDIGAVPAVSAAFAQAFRQPMTQTQLQTVRELVSQLGVSGPRIDALMGTVAAANTPDSAARIRGMLDSGGADNVHQTMIGVLMNGALAMQKSYGGGPVAKLDEATVQPAQFCTAMAYIAIYPATWAVMGLLGYETLAVLTASTPVGWIMLGAAILGAYCA